MIVTLGGQEGEGSVPVPADALGGFFDLVDIVEAEESEGEVPEDGHGVRSVFGPGLVVVFSPGGVSYVVAFVFYAPVPAYVGVYVCWAGPVGGGGGYGPDDFLADPYLLA